jgi:hypothetical protein
MPKKVYIETSIPSFYYEIRPEPVMVARREWTQMWWETQRSHYELVTGIPVLEELEQGNYPTKKLTLELLADLPVLPLEDAIDDIVKEYISRYVMPKHPLGDALHLALASYHRCQFLLTWNCTHLANANKFEHIRHVNHLLGLSVPIITTPVELLNNEEIVKDDER